MPTISSLNPARTSCRIIAISIGLLSTLLLASCGSGGSTDPNATAQSVDDGTKMIQAVSGSTTIPGTSTGRAPKMEVINGIIVPPAPDPVVNNATVAGVDINKNGVRDDVERTIATFQKTDSQRALALAKLVQYEIDPLSPAPTPEEYRIIMCDSSERDVTFEVINTELRRKAAGRARIIENTPTINCGK